MWVYVGTSLESRLKLDRTLGFWLDYWLFLHADETHPVWCSRPLGVRAIASAARDSVLVVDKVLRLQLVEEHRRVAQFVGSLKCLPLSPQIRLNPDQDWPKPWSNWFDQVSNLDSGIIIDELIPRISENLVRNDLLAAAYFTRRLAAELGGDEWSKNQLFVTVKNAICDSGVFSTRSLAASELTDVLRATLLHPVENSYRVTVAVAPVFISKKIAQTANAPAGSPGVRLITEVNGEAQTSLVALEVGTNAKHPHLAAMRAMTYVRQKLELLRLRYYVRTHVHGAIRVTSEVSGNETFVSLPQPFWTKKSGPMRQMPSIPAKFDFSIRHFSAEERQRWNATRWHLSEAFGGWSEDLHTAAAKMWQALESFSAERARGTRKIDPLIDEYLAEMPGEIATYLALRVSAQFSEMRRLSEDARTGPDWYYKNAHTPVETWITRVLGSGSSNHFSKWKNPAAPLLLFHPQIGILQTIHRRLNDPTAEAWMEARIKGDIKLLYGLRNRVLHAGTRVLPVRMAEYLARLAAETLLAIMKQRLRASGNASPA